MEPITLQTSNNQIYADRPWINDKRGEENEIGKETATCCTSAPWWCFCSLPQTCRGWRLLCFYTYCRLKEEFLSYIYILFGNLSLNAASASSEWLRLSTGRVIIAPECLCRDSPEDGSLAAMVPRRRENKHTCAEENTPLDTDVK